MQHLTVHQLIKNNGWCTNQGEVAIPSSFETKKNDWHQYDHSNTRGWNSTAYYKKAQPWRYKMDIWFEEYVTDF